MSISAANNAEFNPSPQDQLYVSINIDHNNKTLRINPNTGEPDGTSGFYAAEPTPDALVKRILKGHAWTACEIKPRSRWREANVLRVNTLTLDLDGDITLGDFWQLPVARRHCLFTATSCSHGNLERQREKGAETSDCFQAVFTTGRTVRPEVVPHLYDVLCERLGHVPVDDHGRKPEALWFGNTQAQVNENPSAVPLPWDWVAEAEHRLEQERQRQALRDSQVSPEDQRLLLERCKAVLRLGLIPDPGPGNYGIWMRVMHAAASGNDGDLLEAFREWSSGTHHGKREQRQLERRLRGAGRKSDPAALLAMAKEADPNWTLKLPQELQPQKRPQVVSMLSYRSATPMVFEDINVTTPPFDQDEEDDDLPDRPQPTVLFSSPRPTIEIEDIQTGIQPPRSDGQVTHQGVQKVVALIGRIYLLLSGACTRPGDGGLTPLQRLIQVSIARSEIMRGNETYRQKPSQIDQLLLQQLMQELGLPTGEQLAAPRRLGDYEQRRHIPVIEGLLAAGCDYILYGVAGCGKTTMALLLARAVIGYPGYGTFLDYPPVSCIGWQNRRVLYIASDGDENAPLDLFTYADRLMMDDQEWMEDNMHILSSDSSGKYGRWTMTVPNLINLARILREGQRCGKPYKLVIFDTLKAICPDDMRVGDQAVTDYIRVIRRICDKYNAAAIYLHHQSRDNESPQGAMGIPEMVHGVYRLTRREGRPVFEVRKTRLDDRGSRDIYYQLEAGVLEVDTNFTPEDENRKLMPGVQLEEDILATYRRHQDDHYLDGGTDADYPGIRPHDLPDLMEVYGYKVSNRVKVTEKARSLRRLGYLKRIPSTKGYRIADASEEAARGRQGDLRDADSGSIPGWD